MRTVGEVQSWRDLIPSMVPQIIDLVVATWAELPKPEPNYREDEITAALCLALRANRSIRELMFLVHTQVVELESGEDQETGRLDIVFMPLVPNENIYFCLECKRLNVTKDGAVRSYAPEYVRSGMMRFVKGKYAKDVDHGGMLAYVFDGRTANAMAAVETAIRQHAIDLCMSPPARLLPSEFFEADDRLRQTSHQRQPQGEAFRIHHIFVDCIRA